VLPAPGFASSPQLLADCGFTTTMITSSDDEDDDDDVDDDDDYYYGDHSDDSNVTGLTVCGCWTS